MDEAATECEAGIYAVGGGTQRLASNLPTEKTEINPAWRKTKLDVEDVCRAEVIRGQHSSDSVPRGR